MKKRLSLRRRYGRSLGKPIAIRKAGSKWAVTVHGNPIVRGPKGITFKGRPGFNESLPSATFDTKEDARGVAHMIGRYIFKLGDLAYGYVEGW